MTDEVIVKQKAVVATAAELAAAREARNMSQVDISQRIKLQVRQVAALEEGRWEALPGRSFVRGALRSYGKLIDVDVAPLLESIGGVQPEQALATPLPASPSMPAGGMSMERGSRASPMLWVIGGLIGVVALVLYFGADPDASKLQSWLPGSESAAPASAPADASGAAATPAVADASSATTAPGTGTALGTATASGAGAGESDTGRSDNGTPGATGAGGGRAARDGASTPEQRLREAAEKAKADAERAEAARAKEAAERAANEAKVAADEKRVEEAAAAARARTDDAAAAGGAPTPAATAASAVATAPVSAPAQATDPVAQKGMIRFTTADDSWIEVRGKDGKALHAAVVKAGETITVQGQPPYRLTLGNAKRLEVEYEGKPRKLPPASPKNITRLVLP